MDKIRFFDTSYDPEKTSIFVSFDASLHIYNM